MTEIIFKTKKLSKDEIIKLEDRIAKPIIDESLSEYLCPECRGLGLLSLTSFKKESNNKKEIIDEFIVSCRKCFGKGKLVKFTTLSNDINYVSGYSGFQNFYYANVNWTCVEFIKKDDEIYQNDSIRRL